MSIAPKRVAVLSPVAWRTPPRHYGAWETVASNITEGLVARGWDVTLFASGDSLTRARLHAVVDRGYEEDPAADPKALAPCGNHYRFPSAFATVVRRHVALIAAPAAPLLRSRHTDTRPRRKESTRSVP